MSAFFNVTHFPSFTIKQANFMLKKSDETSLAIELPEGAYPSL
jgi:hypothetical protein